MNYFANALLRIPTISTHSMPTYARCMCGDLLLDIELVQASIFSYKLLLVLLNDVNIALCGLYMYV